MSMIVSIFALALPWAWVSLAPDREPNAQTTEVRYSRKTVLDFSEVVVMGTVERPDIAYIQPRRRAHFRSLIRFRTSFRPELEISVEAL